MTLAEKIKGLSLPEHEKLLFLAMCSDFERLRGSTLERISQIRTNLGSYLCTLPNHRQRLVATAICLVKHVSDRPCAPSSYFTRHNRVTDHAFCAALERYMGIDVNKLKDQVLEMYENRKWPAVIKDGIIVTFLPEDK